MQIQLLKHSLKLGVNLLAQTFIALIGRQHLLVHLQTYPFILNDLYYMLNRKTTPTPKTLPKA